ncbi:MAG: tetratricopeptide repeat protein [Tannerella sp.]|jgi:tetratricopeptide (TPR) repeat protein|nr:tetratricopeptide repeat protein [Tannerella sp.]
MKKICLLACALWIAVSGDLRAQSYEDMIQKSYEYVDSNDLPAAEECLKAAMRLEPANRYNFALLTNLGTIQRRLGKHDDALVSYSAALSQRANDKLILRNRAELYTEMGETEKAIFDYQTLLSADPHDEEALYQRGLLYLQSANFILAEADFEAILEANPETVWGRLGYAILEKGRGNFDDSELILNYLINKYPDYLRLFEERAELYFLMNRNGRARSDLNRVFAETAEPSAELYVLRGKVKLAQYEKESAAIDFAKALELGYDRATAEALLKQTY